MYSSLRFLFVLFLNQCAGVQNSQIDNYVRSLATVVEQPKILWISHDDAVLRVLPSFITVGGCSTVPPFDNFHVIVDSCFDDKKKSDLISLLSHEQLLITVILSRTVIPPVDSKFRVISLIHQYQTIDANNDVATSHGLQLPPMQTSWKSFVCDALLQPDFPCQTSTWTTTTTAISSASTNTIDLLASVLILANSYAANTTPLVVPAVYRVRPLLSLDVSSLALDPLRTLRFRYLNIISAFVGINMECHEQRVGEVDDEFINRYPHDYHHGMNVDATMDESELSLPFPAESWISLDLRMELLDHVLIQLLKDAPQYCPHMGIDGGAKGEMGKLMNIGNNNENQTASPSSSSPPATAAAAAAVPPPATWMEMIRRAEDAATNRWLFRQLRNLMEHGMTLIALVDRIDAAIAGREIEQFLSSINTGASDETDELFTKEHVYFSYVMYLDELINTSRNVNGGNTASEEGVEGDIRKGNITSDTIKVGQKEIPRIFSFDDGSSTNPNAPNFANRTRGDRDPTQHALVIISMSTWETIKQIADNNNDKPSKNNRNRQGSRDSHQYGPMITDEFIIVTPPSSSSFISSVSTKSHGNGLPSSNQKLDAHSIPSEPSEHDHRSDECPAMHDLNPSESNGVNDSSLIKTTPMVIRLKFTNQCQHHDNQYTPDQQHDAHHTSDRDDHENGYRSFHYDVIVESNAYHRFDLVRQRITHQKTDDDSAQRMADHCQGNNGRNNQGRLADGEPDNDDSSNEIILLTHMGDEALMLPQWISHHASMFHRAYLLDYNSTDNSMQIARAFAPASWKIIPSRNTVFASRSTDDELIDYEARHPHAWKIILTLGEFLVVPHSDLRGYAKQARSRGVTVLRFPSYGIVGDDVDQNNTKAADTEQGGTTCDDTCNKNGSGSFSQFQSLISQRSVYGINPVQAREWFGLNRYARFFHHDMTTYNVSYGSGRHYLEHNGALVTHDTLLTIQRIVDTINNDSYDKYTNFNNQYTHNTTPESTPPMNAGIVSNDENTMMGDTADTTTSTLPGSQLSPQPASEPTLSTPYKAIPYKTISPFVLELSERGFILKYKWSPWPQNIHKMLIINQKYVEKSMKLDGNTPAGLETHTHEYSTVEALEGRRKEILMSHELYDLRHVPLMGGNIYAWGNQGSKESPSSMDDMDDRAPSSTVTSDRCDLLSSMNQLILYLCGGLEPRPSLISNVWHSDIQPTRPTANNHNNNLSASTCSLKEVERWIQRLTSSHINSEISTNPSPAISCAGYYLYDDLRSKLHSTWLTITNNIPHFLMNGKVANERMYSHRSDRLLAKMRHISYTGEYEEHYLNVSFSSLLVANTFLKLQRMSAPLDDSIPTTNLSSLLYTNSTFLDDLTMFCVRILHQTAVNECTHQLFLQLQLFYLDMKFV